MKKILTILTLTLTLTLTAVGQTTRSLRVYQKTGMVDVVRMNANGSIKHSCTDLNGQEHQDYVTIVVTDAEGHNRQYLLSQLDSLVLPTGQRVVFNGSMLSQPLYSPCPPGWIEHTRSAPRRSSFSGSFPGKGTNNVTFYWTANDHIRLDVGSESRAEELTSNGTNASFVFEDDDLEAPSYMVYYPDKSVTIPAVQSQTGADNTEHIGPSGDCGVATATREGDSYNFTLQHKAAYLCFLPHIDHLPSARIEKITLNCSSAIAGTYQLSESGLYNATRTSNTITLNLTPQRSRDFFIGHNVLAEQDSCAAYMVIAPQSSQQTFTATYYITDTLSHIEKIYHQTFSFQPVANTVYPVTCHILDEEFRTIDLGLSVRWSNVNVKAWEPSEVGQVFSSDDEANAALTEQSGVTDWLMPDADQRQELLEKCQWLWDEYNGKYGYIVTGAMPSIEDGNVHRIFLPWTGTGTPTHEECLNANFRPVEALMINLGLKSGVHWASRNIGAATISDYGEYYAWGETTTKGNYTSDNYLYGKRNLGNDLDISGTQNDVATTTWGGLWRMPTKKEWEELRDSCTWTWNNINGVNGYVIEKTTGGTGNKIFLPAAGVWRDGSMRVSGYGASYPSSLQGASNSEYAWTLYYNHNNGRLDLANTNDWYAFDDNNTRSHRYVGRPVRAVASVGNSTDEITYGIRTDSTGWRMGATTARLYGTMTATKPIKGSVTVGFVVGDSATVTKENAVFDLSHTTTVAGWFYDDVEVYDNLGKFYRAYADVGDSIIYGTAKRYGYNLVNLGLPSGTLWANMNLGADEPEHYGYYYAWGETESKTTYNASTYLYGTTENIGNDYDIAGSQYDAAHIQLGNAWRMPTKAQMEELLSSDNCSWEHVTRNSMNGYLVKSKRNGNTLFLPDAGVKLGSNAEFTNEGAAYLTSTQTEDSSPYSWVITWRPGTYDGDPKMRGSNDYYPFDAHGRGTYRYWGRVIRPVYKPSAVTPDGLSVVILTDSVHWKMGDTVARLYGTFTTSKHLDDGYKVGFVIGDSNTIVRNRAMREYVETVSDGCQFTTTQPVAGNLGYWYRSFVEVGDTTYYGEAKHFGIEMVDMGLSVKWANVNVGAEVPEEYGDYYAWGETTAKSRYNSDNYAYGTTQNLGNNYDIAGSPMDAAAMNMGGGWRMPTKDEMQELLNNCDMAWVLQNGVKGYRFTSRKTGNTLFFPSAGLYFDNSENAQYTGYGGAYLTSTQCGDGSNASYVMGYRYGSYDGGPKIRKDNDYYPFDGHGRGTCRYWGRTVRAVFDPNVVTVAGDKMHIVADSAHWKLGDTEARLYATFSHVTPIDGGVTIGIVAGDSAFVGRGTGLYQTEKTVTESDHLMLTVPVTDNLGYWYKAYVVVDGQVYYSEARHFGLEMVDLGLPSRTLWANMNVGSSWPEDYGEYYAWGEVGTKANYNEANYEYGTSVLNEGNISGNADYDAACKNMVGSYWRMPTRTEMQELIDNCNWYWALQDGVKGYRGISKKNNKTIFLPAAGYRTDAVDPQYAGYGGSYMTANQIMDASYRSYSYVMGYRYGSYDGGVKIRVNTDYYPFDGNGRGTVRWFGRSIRAVAVQKAQGN